MSKIDKNIQEAREWRKKHGGEALDFQELDGALAHWEGRVRALQEAIDAFSLARKTAVEARKAVGAALKAAKGSRKAGPSLA